MYHLRRKVKPHLHCFDIYVIISNVLEVVYHREMSSSFDNRTRGMCPKPPPIFTYIHSSIYTRIEKLFPVLQ